MIIIIYPYLILLILLFSWFFYPLSMCGLLFGKTYNSLVDMNQIWWITLIVRLYYPPPLHPYSPKMGIAASMEVQKLTKRFHGLRKLKYSKLAGYVLFWWIYLYTPYIDHCNIDILILPQNLSSMLKYFCRLMQMWKTMYEAHQVQNQISLQLIHLHDNPSTEISTDNRRQATAQLETEVTRWYNSFCKLTKSQRDYVRTLSRWIQLANHLEDDLQHGGYSSVVRSLCESWQHVVDRLPDKVLLWTLPWILVS